MAKQHVPIDSRWTRHAPFRRAGSPYFSCKVRDTRTGRVHFVSTRETKEPKAIRAIVAWVQERSAREAAEAAAASTPRDFESTFRQWLELKTCREVTLASYKSDLDGVYVPFFQGPLVDEVDIAKAEEFRTHLQKAREGSARTVAKHLVCLRSFYRWAVRRGLARMNPFDGLKPPRGAKRETVALGLEQARALVTEASRRILIAKEGLRNVAGAEGGRTTEEPVQWNQRAPERPYLTLFLLIAMHTGLRRRNITTLRWEQVDLSNRRIRIESDEMKGRRAIELPIHPELAEALRASLKGRRKVDPKRLVLGVALESVDSSFHSARKRAGLPDRVSIHSLRHSFASWIASRAPFHVVRDLLGHAPGNVITSHYAHATWEEKLAAVDSLPRLRTASLAGGEAAVAPVAGSAGGAPGA